MDVKQLPQLVNDATRMLTGEIPILTENLENLVEVGAAVFDTGNVDNYARSLLDQIGKVEFVNRKYKGFAPNVLMDGWEYGSIREKIRTELPEATVNEDWTLTNGVSVDPNVFIAPKVSAKFFNSKATYEIDISITEKQVKESFTSPTQLNAFISMIFTQIENSITIKQDALIMRTIDNMIVDTIHADFGGTPLASKTGVKAVNLLYKYNTLKKTTLKANEAINDKDFLKFASKIMSKYIKYMRTESRLFNMGKTDKFTYSDDLHVVLLSDFETNATFDMESDTFHNELVSLPLAETVPYWQGSGVGFEFEDISKVAIKSSSGNMVSTSGILGVMFSREALGVSNYDPRVRTNYNGKGEFMNYFYKQDAGYFNDGDENFVVFFVA